MEKKHLWNVEIAEDTETTFLIVTRPLSIVEALLIAGKFLDEKFGAAHYTLVGITYSGFIDA